MKITRSALKNLIKEEMNRINEAGEANPAGQERTGMVNLDAMDDRDFSAALRLISYNSVSAEDVPGGIRSPWGTGIEGANPLRRALGFIAFANKLSNSRRATLEIDWHLKAGQGVPTLSITAIRATGESHPDHPEKLQSMADELMASINDANLSAQHADGEVSLSEDQDFVTSYNLS